MSHDIPRQVFGQSAGAASTSIHTLLPESYQYFNKAGAASGGYSTFSGATWAEVTTTVGQPPYAMRDRKHMHYNSSLGVISRLTGSVVAGR